MLKFPSSTPPSHEYNDRRQLALQPLTPPSPLPPPFPSYLLFREESIHIDSNQKWVKIFVEAANGTLTIASDNEDGPGAEYSLGSCALHQLSKDQEGEMKCDDEKR